MNVCPTLVLPEMCKICPWPCQCYLTQSKVWKRTGWSAEVFSIWQPQLIQLPFANVTKPYDCVKIRLASAGSWGYTLISLIPDLTQKEGWTIQRKSRPVIGFKVVTPLPSSRVILENSTVGTHIDLALKISVNTASSKATGNKLACIFSLTRHMKWKET